MSEHESSGGEDVGVVRADPKCASSKIETRAPSRLTVRPVVEVELRVAIRAQRKGGAVTRIKFDRPPEQAERQGVPVSLKGKCVRVGAQIQIVGSEIVGRPVGGTAGFGGL